MILLAKKSGTLALFLYFSGQVQVQVCPSPSLFAIVCLDSLQRETAMMLLESLLSLLLFTILTQLHLQLVFARHGTNLSSAYSFLEVDCCF
jgi:hypothetical protein